MQKYILTSSASLTLMYSAAFLLCITFGLMLVQIGTPNNFANLIMLALLLGGYIFAGMLGKTMLLPTFQNADRTGNSFYVGQALASGVISSSIFIMLAGEFYNTGTDALTILLGVIVGLALMTLLFAAPLNRSDTPTISGFLTNQNTSKIQRIIIVAIILAASFLLIHVQLSAIGRISELYFDIPERLGILITVITIGFCLIMGGMRSLTIIRTIAYPIIMAAFLIPLGWMAYKLTGNPIPQLAYGSGALQQIYEIDQEIINSGFVTGGSIFDITRDGLSYDLFNYVCALLCIAFATASMPHLLQHFRTVKKAADARKSGVLCLLFVLIFITAVPALTAFAKLDIYTSLLGLQISELESEASWVFGLSNPNGIALVTICGDYINNAAQVIAACEETSDYFIGPQDIGINTQYLALASAALTDLPDLMTTLLAIGALFAIWTTIDGTALVAANILAEEGYQGVIRPKTPMAFKLFIARVSLILILFFATYMIFNNTISDEFAFNACLAILSASLFPAMVIKCWFKNISQNHMVYGALSGFTFTCFMLVTHYFGFDWLAASGDEILLKIPLITDEVKPLGFGLLGALVFVIITCLLNHFTKPQSKESETNVPA